MGQLLGTRAGRSSIVQARINFMTTTHFWLHLALYCHYVQRSVKNYMFPQSTVAGSLFWIGVLPSVKLGCGSNNFRPNNISFILRLRPQSLQQCRGTHWLPLHFPRCLIDFRKRSIGSRKLTVQPENNTRTYHANCTTSPRP